MSFGPYLSENREQTLGIVLSREGRGWDVVQKRLRDRLEQVAGNLDVEMRYPPFPERGLLVRKLTKEQRSAVDTLLMPSYAVQNANQRHQLRTVPIRENREPMVPLPPLLQRAKVHATLSSEGYHEACGPWANQQRILFIRDSVAHKVVLVCRALNTIGIQPHIEDCFRPPDVQKGLFVRRLVQVARDFPEASILEVQSIASSLTAPEPGLAGHQAGAAIDLRLKRVVRGRLYPLGNEYAEGSVFSCLRCPYITMDQYMTRMLFASVMRMGGFRLLWTEDWHASHGDRGLSFDGDDHVHEVKYGPLKRMDPSTGAVSPYEPNAYDVPFLTFEEQYSITEASRMKKGETFIFTPQEVVDRFRSRLRGRKEPPHATG